MPSLSRLTQSYERAFKHHPSLTLAITNGCLKCLGNFLAQYLPAFSSGQPFVLDIHWSLRFFLFVFLHGPCVGKWHEVCQPVLFCSQSYKKMMTMQKKQVLEMKAETNGRPNV
ncbi:hypothetical protein PGT21_014029 [Puccinia graminis f. sp. tritici]|uniref:Uncharacterized protein n=1 Tax=Puccinia graminis f. sp. tritici TaxID=56615 RepID=A0A5B0PXN2_PUCGR|nr:hypothetical protein PGT21_014029 [Puccinia graminis f. sp. tritici]KAA1125145.1 hypothetical protein PGTUg99_001131 [Puccinia graminis f. sp. tritici]